MKTKILAGIVAMSILMPALQGKAAGSNDVSVELKSLVSKIQAKLQAGKKTEGALAEDIKGFDALLAEHQGEKTDAVADVLFFKAMLYLKVFHDSKNAGDMFRQLKQDFPQTTRAQAADKILASMDLQAAAEKIQAGLSEGSVFPDFNVKDLDGKPLSVSGEKGKVVMLDFWATWCPPCRAELPNVIATYEKHHAQGFEIIGISLDQDRDKLTSFIKEKGMAWPQYFDGQGWQNKLAMRYGVQSIPMTYLLDKDGKIIGSELRGEELEAAVAKAVGGK